MNAIPALHLVDEQEDVTGPALLAQVVATPAGLPWQQARMAALEARSSTPLPLSEVVFQLVRLEVWRPGRPGHFAAVYVRTSEVGSSLSAMASVDGREVPVTFLSHGERARRTRRLAIIGGAAAASVFLLVASVGTALGLRAEAETHLSAAEALADNRLRAVHAGQRLARQSRALAAEDVEGQGLNDMLRDLAWASSSKNPAAQVRAFHWDAGAMALEVRGDAPPFLDPGRPIQKLDKPVRPGVWLWGVEPVR